MPLIATSAVGEAQDVREGRMKQRWRASVLKPDELQGFAQIWVLLRGQWGTDGARVYFRCF